MKPSTAGMSSFRRALYALVLSLSPFLIAEGTLRIVYAIRVGPDVLLYGLTRHYSSSLLGGKDEYRTHSVQFHDNVMQGYTKYLPHQVRIDHDQNGALFRVTINEQGFRGGDFRQQKATGTIRVATLGASSTFGYYARDDETYPSHLGKMLNANEDEAPCQMEGAYEVLNFGVPHLRSTNILSLFREEVADYAPDVITFYEGINDSGEIGDTLLRRHWQGAAWTLFHKAGNRLILVGLLRSIYENKRKFRGLRREAVQQAADASKFISNLEMLRQEAEGAGIQLVVSTQQATALVGANEGVGRVAYEEEVRSIESRLVAGLGLTANEVYLLVHSQLMDRLRRWAKAKEVELVDTIELTNGRRDILLSWVHLNPEGNELVADALASGIRKALCRRVGGGDSRAQTR